MTGIIILAAGASTRLGEPKQMLPYKGKSLLQNATQSAIESGCKPVIVVTGYNSGSILHEASVNGAHNVYNPDWVLGMASSIKQGVNELQKLAPEIDDAILMLCDQPFVDAQLLRTLINERQTTGKSIIACAYKNTLGVPVLFDKGYFPNLVNLKGEDGAKKLILKHKEDVSSIPFPNGAIDIDTKDDYEQLQKIQNIK